MKEGEEAQEYTQIKQEVSKWMQELILCVDKENLRHWARNDHLTHNTELFTLLSHIWPGAVYSEIWKASEV